MSHLEELLTEYYEWRGYIVKHNVLVGRRARGGWEMELDIVAYDPHKNQLLHVEPSLDAHPWAKREQRFKKKFEAGRKYILGELFPWLPLTTPLTQRAILVSASPTRRTLAGAEVQTVDELIGEICNVVFTCGIVAKAAISERYPLLRTIQFSVSGYYRKPKYGSRPSPG